MTIPEDAIRLLLDDGPWTARRLADLASVMDSEAEARRLVAAWHGMERQVHADLQTLVPERSDLVLLALDRREQPGLLTESEQERLRIRRPELDDALDRSPALADVVRAIGADADAFDAAWTADLGQPAARPDRPALRRAVPMRRVLSRFAVAASIVAFVAVAFLLQQRDRFDGTIVASDGVRVVNLADGSSVRLMAGAELAYHEGAVFERRVRLDGRAYFTVRPDEVPFEVLTPGATVTVLGTSFGVDAGSDETEVVLVSGRVAVAPAGAPEQLIVLEPGERTRIRPGIAPEPPSPVDVQQALDWTGMLLFRSTPLADAAGRLEAAYGVQIGVDEALADVRVNGTFEPERAVSDILDALAAAIPGSTARETGPGTYLIESLH